MEHINNLINQSQQQTEQESQTRQSLTHKHIALIWIRMSKIFGHKWVSSFGEQDDGTWLKGLDGLAPDQVAHGLGIVMEVGEEWPPSLPSFRKMCLGEHEIEVKTNAHGLDYTPQVYRQKGNDDQKKLANPATEVTRKAAMDKMRAMFGRVPQKARAGN